MTIDKEEVPGLYFGTSTGQIFASADEGESWNEIASYLPPVWSVEVHPGGVSSPRNEACVMADVHLPATLTPLFAGLPRRLDLDAQTVDGAVDRLDERWPGLRDRLCHPGPTLRSHIHVYVDQHRAGLTRRSTSARAST